jgi:hypothetical protein
MTKIIHRATAGLIFTALVVASMILLTGTAAAATGAGQQTDVSRAESDSNVTPTAAPEPATTAQPATTVEHATTAESVKASGSETAPASTPVEPKTINVSYALFDKTIKLQPVPAKISSAQLRPELLIGKAAAVKSGVQSNIWASPAPPAVSTAPMSVGEKAHYWIKSSFLSAGAYAQSAFAGLFNELLDNNEGKKDTVEDYFADAGTRAVRSFTFRATSGFFEKFAYASIFKQDPRYHRSDKKGFGGKIGYAISRVFITQGDRCGCDQFNISYLGGGLTAAFIANEWERDERTGTSKAFRRWGTHIGLTILGNILKEFLGGQ